MPLRLLFFVLPYHTAQFNNDGMRVSLSVNRACRSGQCAFQLQKLAFGGKVKGQNFGVRTYGPARYRSSQVTDDLLAAGRRLEDVTIENLDWSAFIARYDREGALFIWIRRISGASEAMVTGLAASSSPAWPSSWLA